MSRRAAGGPDEAGARERILARVRAALRDREGPGHPGPREADGVAVHPPVERFVRRLRENGAEAVRLGSAAEASRWLGELARGFGSVAAGPELARRDDPGRPRDPARPPDLDPPDRRGHPDDRAHPDRRPRPDLPPLPDLPELPPAEADLGVSLARAGVAETGSVLLDGREGRRLQILPPTHLVWVRAEDVVATLDEALERIRDEGTVGFALHSGPSKSADLGGHLVRGVHGPGRLVVAVTSWHLGAS